MKFLKETHIDFLAMRRYGMVVSAALIFAGLISLMLQGGPRLSIDFEGGTLVQIRFQKEADIGKIRSALESSISVRATFRHLGLPMKSSFGCREVKRRRRSLATCDRRSPPLCRMKLRAFAGPKLSDQK